MARAVLLVALLLASHLLAGCDGKPAAGAAPSPPAVTVARPLQKKITEWDEYTGRFIAVETVEVRARVSRRPLRLRARRGRSFLFRRCS